MEPSDFHAVPAVCLRASGCAQWWCLQLPGEPQALDAGSPGAWRPRPSPGAGRQVEKAVPSGVGRRSPVKATCQQPRDDTESLAESLGPGQQNSFSVQCCWLARSFPAVPRLLQRGLKRPLPVSQTRSWSSMQRSHCALAGAQETTALKRWVADSISLREEGPLHRCPPALVTRRPPYVCSSPAEDFLFITASRWLTASVLRHTSLFSFGGCCSNFDIVAVVSPCDLSSNSRKACRI
ncbi:PREDICTED: uncharacterized protein LOC102007346 [Chinchilla lanigera]|uniref:uncharacterized protein LOC102007346 n=1 Tax=Chinchilla lanigera TaxID=34839 RepID=UPI0006962B65|nr:PREDICTED: uncharacterized protein LOC102007346 [Chinchilla lanigera]